MRLLWFVFAGFLLGFSVSTLWEWLYFRRRRITSQEIIDDHREETWSGRYHAGDAGAAARNPRAATRGGDVREPVGEIADADADADEWEATYAGPGVFLEFEDETPEDETPTDTPADAPSPAYTRPTTSTLIRPSETDKVASGTAPDTKSGKASVTGPDNARGAGDSADAPANSPQSNEGAARRSNRAAGFVSPPPAPARPGVARSSRPVMPERFRGESTLPEAAENTPDTTPRAKPPQPESAPASPPAAAPASEPSSQGQPPRTEDTARPGRKTDNYPDDLAKIKGIGEVYKQRLYAAGIYTWHQIAQTDEETLRAATQAYPSSNVDEWAAQAVKLAEKHNRKGAEYSGPPPQELTRIYGIGPVGATTLYRAGICTYAQLAAATPAKLAPLFPIAVAGDEPDFAHWIAQAQEYSQDES